MRNAKTIFIAILSVIFVLIINKNIFSQDSDKEKSLTEIKAKLIKELDSLLKSQKEVVIETDSNKTIFSNRILSVKENFLEIKETQIIKNKNDKELYNGTNTYSVDLSRLEDIELLKPGINKITCLDLMSGNYFYNLEVHNVEYSKNKKIKSSDRYNNETRIYLNDNNLSNEILSHTKYLTAIIKNDYKEVNNFELFYIKERENPKSGLLYFCEDFDASKGEKNISNKFNTGPLTVVYNSNKPVNTEKILVQILKYENSKENGEVMEGFYGIGKNVYSSRYKQILFDVKPELSYIFLKESDKYEMSIEDPGTFYVAIWSVNDNDEYKLLAENSLTVIGSPLRLSSKQNFPVESFGKSPITFTIRQRMIEREYMKQIQSGIKQHPNLKNDYDFSVFKNLGYLYLRNYQFDRAFTAFTAPLNMGYKTQLAYNMAEEIEYVYTTISGVDWISNELNFLSEGNESISKYADNCDQDKFSLCVKDAYRGIGFLEYLIKTYPEDSKQTTYWQNRINKIKSKINEYSDELKDNLKAKAERDKLLWSTFANAMVSINPNNQSFANLINYSVNFQNNFSLTQLITGTVSSLVFTSIAGKDMKFSDYLTVLNSSLQQQSNYLKQNSTSGNSNNWGEQMLNYIQNGLSGNNPINNSSFNNMFNLNNFSNEGVKYIDYTACALCGSDPQYLLLLGEAKNGSMKAQYLASAYLISCHINNGCYQDANELQELINCRDRNLEIANELSEGNMVNITIPEIKTPKYKTASNNGNNSYDPCKGKKRPCAGSAY